MLIAKWNDSLESISWVTFLFKLPQVRNVSAGPPHSNNNEIIILIENTMNTCICIIKIILQLGTYTIQLIILNMAFCPE